MHKTGHSSYWEVSYFVTKVRNSAFSKVCMFVLTGFVFNRSLCTFSYFEFYCRFLSSWQEFRKRKCNLLSCRHAGLPSKNAKCVCSNVFKKYALTYNVLTAHILCSFIAWRMIRVSKKKSCHLMKINISFCNSFSSS